MGRIPRDERGRRLRASLYTSRGPRRVARARGIAMRRVSLLLIGTFAVSASLVLGTQAFAAFTAELPDVHLMASRAPFDDSLVYAADGKTVIADLHPDGLQHYGESMTEMGTLLPQATVAVEDANFYSEKGLDPPAIARAAWVDLQSHRNVEGGSTITQQLVKLRLLDNTPSFQRKLREAALAVEAEKVYSKRQILEMYLNSVSYANGAQGSRAAAEIYFHKPTGQLDLAQASMLAGIPQNPTFNNPITNWDTAKVRQRVVLDAMVRQHMVTDDQANAAFAEDLKPPAHMFTPGPQIRAYPGFTQWVDGLLETQFGKEKIQTGGLRVVTTLNASLQEIAQKAVVDQVQAEGWRHLTQGALVSIDPRTGAVAAMVGAADSNNNGGQFDMAVWPPRNPGSSFKVYNYTAAIESGKYTMVSNVNDSAVRITLPPGSDPAYYEPKNYDGKWHGTCQLQQCMGNSLNVPAVKVEVGVGVSAVAQEARKMGAPPWQQKPGGNFTNDDALDTFGYSLTLGGYGETPLQMATGVSVLAAQGVLRMPYGIQQVTTHTGTTVYTAHPESAGKQVLDPKVAFIMAQIMSDDDNRAMIFGHGSALTLPGRRVAAKTGTTDGFTDGWTVGFTPDLATAVWMGNPDYSPMVQGSDGVYVAAPAWHAYMQGALDNLSRGNTWYQEPAGLTRATVNGKTAWFMPGTSPSTVPPKEPGAPPSNQPRPSPSPGDNQGSGGQGGQGAAGHGPPNR